MLCFVLFFFALGAKAALYRPNQAQVKEITATKVWQNKAVPRAADHPVMAVVPVLAGAMLLALSMKLTGRGEVGLVRPEPTPIRSLAWFSRYLAVRPPPVI
jgi:hypothetical protein